MLTPDSPRNVFWLFRDHRSGDLSSLARPRWLDCTKPARAAVIVTLFAASTAVAENIYEASARQREHDSYISQQSNYNTRYFNNADNYPKIDTNNYERFRQQQAQSYSHSFVTEPVVEVQLHQQTPAEHFEEDKQKSAAGDVDAKLELADCYYTGWGTSVDRAKALELYRAIGVARPRAVLMAGTMIYTGIGTAANRSAGIALLESAGAGGGVEVANWLAVVHPTSDQVEAEAAKNNYAPMLTYAVELFYGRDGRPQDKAKAIAYLQRGANAGDKSSANWLATLYIAPEAFDELKRKSAGGDVDAKVKLADLYYEGNVVAEDRAEAYRLYHEVAAVKPYAEGQAGYMLVMGEGVGANENEGLALLKHAAAVGDKDSVKWLARRFPAGEALAELKRNSEAGDHAAQVKLANAYYQGGEIPLKSEAYRLYREAAAADPFAESMAGAMLYCGEGVAANEADGLAMEKHAAAAGDQGAIRWLADQFPTQESIELSAAKKDFAPMLEYASELMYGRKGKTKDEAQALTYFKRLVDAGYTPALLYLGTAYSAGLGVKEDLQQAEQIMLKADAAGDKEAAHHLAIVAEDDTPEHPRDLVKMRKWAEKYLAAMQTPEAFDLMGRLEYFSGNKEKARTWWLKAVEGGFTENEYELGFLEWSGQAGPIDETGGRKHFEAVAAEGDERALYELGVAYKAGSHGLPADLAKAIELFEESAEKGLAEAANNLAMIYYTGDGVDKNVFKAAVWAEMAADKGSANSQYVIGILYAAGDGVDQDLVKSAQYMQKASDQGLGFAMCSLAEDYSTGSGVPQDPSKAAMWAQKAADNGSRNALTMLAKFYKLGEGVPKDAAKSVEWMQKAADRGSESAKAEMANGYNGQ